MKTGTARLTLGLLAVCAGVSAAAAVAVIVGNRRVDEWETLTPEDAGEGNFVELADGTRMHYFSRGAAGSPVILIHGLMDSAFHWHKNIDALAEHHRVWAIDLIGFGFSSRPRQPNYSLKSYARHVREFMDAQGIDRASIVGHSLGGAVTLEFAHDYPQRVDKLVLIAPATFLLQFRPQIKLAAHLPVVPRAVIGYTITSARARMAAWRGAVGNPSHVDLEEMEIRLRPQRVKGTAEALLAMLSSPHLSDLPGGLNQITASALILWGKNDSAVPLRHGGYHERDLPNGELVVLEGAGHIPQSEYPQVVNRLVLDFLARDENTLHRENYPV
jgi:pimeloyl-ACP methyl ester carboxylesterase